MGLVVCVVLLAACGSATPPPPPATRMPPTPTAARTRPDTASARGQRLFRTTLPEVGFACATCHYDTSSARLIGPGFKDYRASAARHQPAAYSSLEAYTRDSILNPTAFIVPAEPPYQANIMPSRYGDLLTADQIDDLVAYLFSL